MFCVAEARCAIEGPAEKFVRSGSQLRLSCHIEQATTEPEYMFWFKDGVMVNYDDQNVYQVGALHCEIDSVPSTLSLQSTQ